MAKTTSSLKNFEKSMDRLEEIVSLLEEGDCSLEELLKLYEEGSKLARDLKSSLDVASERLNELAELGEDENNE